MKRTHNMVFGMATLAAVLLSGIAAIAIWLLLAQPLSTATAVSSGDLSAILRAIGDVLTHIVRSL
jgi:hypothetical protein